MDCNEQFARMTGYSVAELRGVEIANLVVTEDRDLARANIRQGIDSVTELTALSKDGRRIVVEAHGRPVSPGSTRRHTAVRDITERKKSEAHLIKLNEDMAARNLELENLNKELESFIYSVSHDLRAPIRTMSGFANIIMEDYADKLDEEGKSHLLRIQAGSKKMAQLIEDLLRLSRITRQEMERTETDLSSKASAAVATLRESDPGRNVEVVIHPALKASADPRLIELALLNILENAWKFTSKTEQARIDFGATEKNGKMVYFVKDNGAGFDPLCVEKMFLPFHRLHSEQEFEGTGIGLAIVERIIHRHNGTIWAEGEAGKGATIYFTLG